MGEAVQTVRARYLLVAKSVFARESSLTHTNETTADDTNVTA